MLDVGCALCRSERVLQSVVCLNVASPEVRARGVLSRYRGTRDCNFDCRASATGLGRFSWPRFWNQGGCGSETTDLAPDRSSLLNRFVFLFRKHRIPV